MLGRAVVAHHVKVLHSLAVEPGHNPAQEADGRALLLVREVLNACNKACGVVDRLVSPVVADAGGTALLPLAGDAMPYLAGECQSFADDVN